MANSLSGSITQMRVTEPAGLNERATGGDAWWAVKNTMWQNSSSLYTFDLSPLARSQRRNCYCLLIGWRIIDCFDGEIGAVEEWMIDGGCDALTNCRWGWSYTITLLNRPICHFLCVFLLFIPCIPLPLFHKVAVWKCGVWFFIFFSIHICLGPVKLCHFWSWVYFRYIGTISLAVRQTFFKDDYCASTKYFSMSFAFWKYYSPKAFLLSVLLRCLPTHFLFHFPLPFHKSQLVTGDGVSVVPVLHWGSFPYHCYAFIHMGVQ